jgi:hypothetical protein
MTDIDLEYTPTITPISRPTHDTPEAALAAALDKSELARRYEEYARAAYPTTMMYELPTEVAAYWAPVILTSLDGWTLISNADRDAAFIEGVGLTAKVERLRAALLVVAGNPAITADTMHDIARAALSEGGSDAK